jgi:hypothetical protein
MTPAVKHLWAAVVRGQAIQCSHNQEVMDIIIPVVLKPYSKVTEKDMSAILIQVKNRADDVTAIPTASQLRWFIGASTPYISILLELGLQKSEGKRRIHLAQALLTA